MLDIKDIIWSECCVDPGSRVFFIGNRVFRAYDITRSQETLEFLQSDCYANLLREQMIVRTWVATDITIKGWALILEHENLSFLPEVWHPFDMMRDILSFHFKVNAICKEYGYGLRDIGYGNVTLCNGKLCFTDFGSFRKLKNVDMNIYEQHCLPLAYLPLSLYSRHDGNDFLAHNIHANYSAWCASVAYPASDTIIHNQCRPYLHAIVDHYDVYFRNRGHHFRVRSKFSLNLIKCFNYLVNIVIASKHTTWKLIKIQNIYSEEKAIKVVGELAVPYKGDFILPVGGDEIIKNIPKVISKHIKHSIKRIVLWGNFQYESLLWLRENFSAEIVVMSNDSIYANNLYGKLKSNNVAILVACCNVMRGRDFKILKTLNTDLLIIMDDIYEQAKEIGHSDWAEKASYFAKYILSRPIPNEEMLLCKLSNFYDYTYEEGYLIGQRVCNIEGVKNDANALPPENKTSIRV